MAEGSMSEEDQRAKAAATLLTGFGEALCVCGKLVGTYLTRPSGRQAFEVHRRSVVGDHCAFSHTYVEDTGWTP